MATSIMQAQRGVILNTVHHVAKGVWKVMIVDRESRRILDNVVDEDDILHENITNIEQITDRRPTNRDVDALYFLTPQAHVVDCLMADLGKKKYKRAHLVWTSLLHPALRDRIDKSPTAREQIAQFTTLNVEYYPRESHLVSFRDPWSFPILYHPACNHLVRQHLEDLAQKIVGVCVALGEYPTIRYYHPSAPTHEASVLSSHLARFVQDELDLYAKFHNDFPPSTPRPRGTLYILDRSLDLFTPFVHEFTYQAMAHDLLPIKDGEKVTYRTLINEGLPDQEEKEIPITEKDRLWTENRHRHMKDVIEKLMADFQKFLKDNPGFTRKVGENAVTGSQGLSLIKDMMAGLPQFTEQKEAYALHLGMAQESMNRFQRWKLGDLSAVEQICATGLDEEYKKPRHLADQIIRLLDEPEIQPPDRLRLLILYLLHKDGLLATDTQNLLSHAQLPTQQSQQIIGNLTLLGANTTRRLKDPRPLPQPLFPRRVPPPANADEDLLISRFEPVLQRLLETHATGLVDANTFPYTKPPLDPTAEAQAAAAGAASLRSAKPTWARSRTAAANTETRQRVIVFMAGGATYAESRVCYEVGKSTGREIVMVTSHLLTPELFVRQVGDLSLERRALGLPVDQAKEVAPKHLFDPEPGEAPRQQVQPQAQVQGQGHAVQQQQRPPQQPQQQVPVQAMAGMGLNGPRPAPAGAPRAPQYQPQQQQQPVVANSSAKVSSSRGGKPVVEEKKEKEKKRRFGFGKS